MLSIENVKDWKNYLEISKKIVKYLEVNKQNLDSHLLVKPFNYLKTHNPYVKNHDDDCVLWNGADYGLLESYETNKSTKYSNFLFVDNDSNTLQIEFSHTSNNASVDDFLDLLQSMIKHTTKMLQNNINKDYQRIKTIKQNGTDFASMVED